MSFVNGMYEIGPRDSLAVELEHGIAITRDVDDSDFATGRGGESSIGAHIRHNLDFVNALLNGIVERRIDYNTRPRDPRVESDRDYAAEQLSFACRRVRSLTTDLLASLVMVRSEVNEDIWHASSVSREIEYLHSHTVHHYAVIARLMADAGKAAIKSLGVAPSTLRFRAEQRQKVYSGKYLIINY